MKNESKNSYLDFMSQSNIGFSEIGGYFIGRNIISDFHKDHGISIILSPDQPFEIKSVNNENNQFTNVLIQRDFEYSFKSLHSDPVVFIHIDPFSDIGLKLYNKHENIINICHLSLISIYFEFLKSGSGKPDKSQTERLLRKLVDIISGSNSNLKNPDERILKSIGIIKNEKEDELSLNEVANKVHLSPSRFAHLFKQETGSTFRKFVLYHKLVNAINAMHKDQNLTEASFQGGFSDQPHFTRTFKKAFGINPSTSKK